MNASPPPLASVYPAAPAVEHPRRPPDEFFAPRPMATARPSVPLRWLRILTALWAIAAPLALTYGLFRASGWWYLFVGPWTLADVQHAKMLSDHAWSYPWVVTRVYAFFATICLVFWFTGSRQTAKS